MLSAVDFNPLLPKAGEAIVRLTQFHKIIAEHSARNFPSLVMNDGAALFRDLSLRSNSVSYEFLVRCWRLFLAIKELESLSGYPGARAVLAIGFRMTGPAPDKSHSSGLASSVLKRLRSGYITPEQAVREAAEIRPSFGIVRELQANFAFTKAYVAESSGGKGGFSGANFFVDLGMFDDPLPSWLNVSSIIDWENERLHLSSRFGRLDGLAEPVRLGSTEAPGMLSGLQVAERISGLEDVLKILRSAR